MAKIRIIDDDAEFLENTATMLRKEGHEVSALDSVDDAVQILIDEKPDVLLLDVMFPNNPVAGFDLARRIRLRREIKDLPILLLTGVNQEFPMDFSAGDIDPDWMPVQDFVEKPASSAVLIEKIQAMLNAKA